MRRNYGGVKALVNSFRELFGWKNFKDFFFFAVHRRKLARALLLLLGE
jgi:hypothetical protein